MTLIAIILFALALGFGAGSVVTRRRLRGKPAPAPPLLAAGTPVAELVEGFREYARAVDGGVTEEVERALGYLSAITPDERRLLAAGVLVLEGAMLDAYRADYAAAKSPGERGSVIQRWDRKGYLFPQGLRSDVIASGSNEAARNFWRKMFDEQDARLIKKEQA